MPTFTPLARNTIVLSWLFVVCACAFTANLLYQSRGAPEAFLAAALVVGILLISQTTWAIVDEGMGEHQRDLSRNALSSVAKSLIVNEALWSLTNALIRIAAGLVMLKILSDIKGKLRYFTITTICICAVHGLVSVLEVLLICRPLSLQWDPGAKGACGNQTTSFVAIEVSGLVLDVAILMCPILLMVKLIWGLWYKLKVIFFLDIGVVVLVITGLRLKALNLATSPDFSYSKSYLSLLSGVGSMLSIMLCGVPAFWKMLVRTKTRWTRARPAP